MKINDSPDASYITDELVEKADRLFEKAEQAAENEEVRLRIARERLSVEFIRLARLDMNAPGRNEGIDNFEEKGKIIWHY